MDDSYIEKYICRGFVPTFNDLPKDNLTVGDTYSMYAKKLVNGYEIIDEHMFLTYAWTGVNWTLIDITVS